MFAQVGTVTDVNDVDDIDTGPIILIVSCRGAGVG